MELDLRNKKYRSLPDSQTVVDAPIEFLDTTILQTDGDLTWNLFIVIRGLSKKRHWDCFSKFSQHFLAIAFQVKPSRSKFNELDLYHLGYVAAIAYDHILKTSEQ